MEHRITKNTLCQELVFKMITYIENGSLHPGDLLPSVVELANQFGVGRNSMREALAALSAMGYITSMAGVGTVVSHPSFENLMQPFARLLAQKTVSADEFAGAGVALSAAHSEQPDNRAIAIIQQLCYALATDRNTNAGNTLLSQLQAEEC